MVALVNSLPISETNIIKAKIAEYENWTKDPKHHILQKIPGFRFFYPDIKSVKYDIAALRRNLVDPQELKDLEKELKLNLDIIESRFSYFNSVQVNASKFLVTNLAHKIATLLKGLFDKLFAEAKDRPRTADEERQLENLAKRLKVAYELAGASQPLIEQADLDAAGAPLRAAEKDEQDAKIEAFNNTIAKLQKSGDQSYSTKIAIARTKVKLIESELKELMPYPSLLKEKIEQLIAAKIEIVELVPPDTSESMAVKREITEYKIMLKKVDQMVVNQGRIAVLEGGVKTAEATLAKVVAHPNPNTFVTGLQNGYRALLAAKESLFEAIQLTNQQGAKKIETEIAQIKGILNNVLRYK